MRSRFSEASSCFSTWARGEAAVAVGHREEELGGEDVGIARAAGERLAEEGLGGAAAVDVGGVDEVDADLEGAIEAGARGLRLDADAVGQPRPERDFGDLEIAGAELPVSHVILLRGKAPRAH